jgi:hypothetical protein
MRAATLLGLVLTVATVLSAPVGCQSRSVAGRNEFAWVTNGDNTITITGYTGTGTVVTIPGRINGLTVTMIGNEAFLGNGHLSDVTIPDSVTTIGDLAFLKCLALTRIGNTSFSLCGLTTVTIPATVTSIGGGSFSCCSYLTNVIVGVNVTNIGVEAFSNCQDLKGLFCKGDAPSCDDLFFNNDRVTVYYLPGTKGWGPTFGGRPTAVWKPEGGTVTNGVPVAGTQR